MEEDRYKKYIEDAISPIKTFLDSFWLKGIVYTPHFLRLVKNNDVERFEKEKNLETEGIGLQNKIIKDASLILELSESADIALNRKKIISAMALVKTLNEHIGKFILLYGYDHSEEKGMQYYISFCKSENSKHKLKISDINNLLPKQFASYKIKYIEHNKLGNDWTHKNYFFGENLKGDYFEPLIVKPLIDKLENIIKIFFITTFSAYSVPFTSTDYSDAAANGITPEEGSQYIAAPGFVAYLRKNFSISEQKYFISGEKLNIENCKWE